MKCYCWVSSWTTRAFELSFLSPQALLMCEGSLGEPPLLKAPQQADLTLPLPLAYILATPRDPHDPFLSFPCTFDAFDPLTKHRTI